MFREMKQAIPAIERLLWSQGNLVSTEAVSSSLEVIILKFQEQVSGHEVILSSLKANLDPVCHSDTARVSRECQ